MERGGNVWPLSAGTEEEEGVMGDLRGKIRGKLRMRDVRAGGRSTGEGGVANQIRGTAGGVRQIEPGAEVGQEGREAVEVEMNSDLI